MEPYYQDSHVTIYCGDCRGILPLLPKVGVIVTDPPYGIAYKTGAAVTLRSEIQGDADTSLRDWVLQQTRGTPALVFGSWKRPKPVGAKMVLVWDTGGALGMGDLSLPWKPSHAEIYVLGGGFIGKRTGDVLSFAPVQSQAYNGRVHPHQKPLGLMKELVGKCPAGVVLDPFAGSGTTLRAAKDLNRKAIGIEIEEADCEIAAQRMTQEVLDI